LCDRRQHCRHTSDKAYNMRQMYATMREPPLSLAQAWVHDVIAGGAEPAAAAV
jgi:hypothetical protein